MEFKFPACDRAGVKEKIIPFMGKMNGEFKMKYGRVAPQKEKETEIALLPAFMKYPEDYPDLGYYV